MCCIDMRRMLDLPPELKCQIFRCLLADEQQLDTYFTLLEHPEFADLLRCNFAHQLRFVQQHRSLASQLQQILITTAHLSAAPPRSSRRLAVLLGTDVLARIYTEGSTCAVQAVSMISNYHIYLRDADTTLAQFAKMTRGNTVI